MISLLALPAGKLDVVARHGLLGERLSEMQDICDIVVKTPARETYQSRIPIAVYHTLCLMIECEVFGCNAH